MKKKTVIIILAGIMALGTASTVYAAQTEETIGAETEDALLYLYGSWIQGSSMSLVFTPDQEIYDINWSKEQPICEFSVENGRILCNLDTMPEEYLEGAVDPELSMELVEATEEAAREFIGKGDLYAEPGKDQMLKITSGMTDETDPLNPEKIEGTVFACKEKNPENYLNILLKDSCWELDGKLLKLEADPELYDFQFKIDFDHGKQTGVLSVWSGGEIGFSWDGGTSIIYNYVTTDTDSITLANKQDPEKTVVLKMVSEETQN